MPFPRSFDSPAGECGRRRFLIDALGSVGVASVVTLTSASRLFAGQEFWNAKDPSAWTEEEIALLTSKSPWARQAVATFKNIEDDPTTEGGRGAGAGRRPAAVPIIMRWESAQPILDALRVPLAAEFEGHYVLSVTNLPITVVGGPGRGSHAIPEDTLARLQNGATLEVKGKEPVEAGFARGTHIGSLIFGFLREQLRLTPSDREILFKLDLPRLVVKTKFDAKEMMYHGKLAV
jgi:hypothetical protein